MPQRIDTPTRAISRPDPEPPPAGGDERVGSVLAGRYQLLQRLGDGAMGAVYLAEHMALRRKVAVKVLHAELSRMAEVVARFEREAVAAANIDHPNVAAAFDFGSLEDGTFFLALEYVEGRCLRDEISGPMQPERVVHVVLQIARALERAHALGIVHRDLKPENIMLVQRGGDPDFVKVLDFGIARMRMGEDENTGGKALTRAGMVYGTPEYMAPEQALGLPVDARADLYALGMIAFEMLTGVRPFEAENTVILLGMQVTSPFPKFAERAPQVELHPELEDIVYRLTAKSADQRLQSAAELATALEAFEGADGGYESKRVQITPATSRSQRPPPVDTTGRTMFTASGETTDTRLLLGTIQKILLRTWHEVRPLCLALWLKIPERYRTPRVLAITIGSVATLWFVLILTIVFSGNDSEVAEPKDDGPVAASASSTMTAPDPSATLVRIQGILTGGDLDEARRQIDAAPLEPVVETELRQQLVRAFFRAGRRVEAFRQLENLYNHNPSDTELADIAVDVEKALTAADSSSLAFAYLEGHPSNLGADVLYKIAAEGRASRAVTDRATKLLGNSFVRQHASQAVLIAADLRAAGRSCKVAQLLQRARDVGDQRALPYLYDVLKPALVTKKKLLFNADAVDKLACLHKDDTLSSTIVAIEQRTGTPHRSDAAP